MAQKGGMLTGGRWGGVGSGLSVRSKFLLMMLLTSLLGLGAITYLAYQSGRQALTEAATKQMTGNRSAKKQEVETYFRTTRDATRLIADAPIVASAIEDFAVAFRELDKSAVSEERVKALTKFYSEEFMPRLRANTDTQATLEEYLPRRPAAQLLQSMYIVENANKIGEKARLLKAPGNDTYARAHERYHRWFTSVADRLKFYDVMLIDAESGAVVYSLAKEAELGQDVTSTPIAGSNMGQLARDVMRTQRAGEARFSDFAFYGPSYNIPAAFVAAPVFANQKLVGVMVGQMSIEALSQLMHNGGKWRELGLGETGAVYLVGSDQMMRSDTREIIENADKYVGEITKAGTVNARIAERIGKQKTTVLHYPVRNEPVRNALRGQTGNMTVTNRRGQGVLFAYAPLDIPDLNWVVVARMDQNEILAAQIRFNRNVMIAACTLALLGTLAAMWLAGMFLRPVNALMDGIQRLKKGERNVLVESRTRDEFNDLVQAFNGMASTIQQRDEVIEAKSHAYEQLLRRIFPEAVASRMRQGEAAIVESFVQVTVVYMIIDGFAEAASGRTADGAITLLNEIVDRFDEVAERKGVEKVKTIGDHYLAASGLSVARLDNAIRALEFARLAWQELVLVNRSNGLQLGLRVGIATGPVQAGLVGSRRFVFDIWGQAASAARRIVYEADANSVRLNAAAQAQLTDKRGLGEDLVVRSKSMGSIDTRQLRFETLSTANAAK